MTSASEESFTKPISEDMGGAIEVTTMLAVDVGERCRVIGWDLVFRENEVLVYPGFGRARTWACKLVSRNVA